MDGVISLGVGEPDFRTPWVISDAGIQSIMREHTTYTSNYGTIELRTGIARHLERLYGVSYNPATEILVTVGVSEAMDLSMRALLDPGDEVLVPEPTYVAYNPCVILAGGTPVGVPTYMEHGFRLQAADIEQRITPATKAIILGYPNNPTGAVLSREDMQAIADLAHRHDLLVISDEIYDRLVYDTEHTCFTSLAGMRERSVLLGGFSKAYAMTGWRIGYAAGPAPIIEAMMKVHQYVAMCAPTMSQDAAVEALISGEPEVERMREQYNYRRQFMVASFNQMGLACFEPKGAFYTFPSIRATGMTSEEFAEALLREEKVAVVPGSAFGASGEGFVRACYAASLDQIKDAMERMARFTARHRVPE
ncbi:MAG: aminotransferase class I/II-fold pyridoxal phosphate-dependent enzyme [Dehalococcoidia bacterium]|nr:aminotransferase class I/II-fold pyridoxal phosphate-dependent enzyme [Dehalococcoidia bacterium]